MNELTCCPYCQNDFVIKAVECTGCETKINGNFTVNRFHIFNPEDLFFIEIFLKNEGNIKLMEKDLGISYPTVKSRLKSIIKILGYQAEDSNSTQRIKILNDLSSGIIDVKGAIKNLRELK
ncbi:MAG: hypothetical protein ACD_46C00220G0004 [uncultured bacterium]|nr:MAG: hypothetical protein ACD_46C00220G0004 [uncultured bacterium]